MIEKELLESIEQLGDQLEIVEQLARGISNKVREVYGIHSFTIGILHVNKDLLSASIDYTEFYEEFFTELNKNKNL